MPGCSDGSHPGPSRRASLAGAGQARPVHRPEVPLSTPRVLFVADSLRTNGAVSITVDLARRWADAGARLAVLSRGRASAPSRRASSSNGSPPARAGCGRDSSAGCPAWWRWPGTRTSW